MTASTSTQRRSLPDNKRLVLYTAAAGAALAAGASTAEASLITLDLTGLSTASRSTGGPGNDLYFDVNATSAAAAVSSANFAGADFRLFNYGPAAPFYGSVSGLAAGNGIAGFQEEIFKASNLQQSNFVGPDQQFDQIAKVNGPVADFGLNDSGFLGLRFLIGADVHYGWAKIETDAFGQIILDGLGYETLADTAVHVEDPSSPGPSVPDQGSTLALMALGAAGLAAARSRVRLARVTQ
jgi:protein with PEP-CTERM/exosortase system signal